MKKLSAAGTVLGLVTGDQALKKYMKHHLEGGDQEIFNGRATLRRFDNPGACLGFLKDHPTALHVITGSLLFSLVRKICSVSGHRHKLGEASLVLMIAGGASNMLDRICQGYVDDYINISCRSKRLSKIVFNLADVMVLSGAVLSVIAAVFEKD